MSGHDTKHRLARRDRAGAIRPGQDHSALFLIAAHVTLDADHVLGRNAVGNADAVFDAGVGRFHDRVGREWRGREDD